MRLVELKGVRNGEVVLGDGRSFRLAEAPEWFPYGKLNPLQTLFWRTYKGGRALVVAPTSSGKTGVGMLFLRDRGVYAAPTKSLATEIYEKFVKVYGEKKVALKTGDVFDEYEDERDLYVCTYESLANALRTGKDWARPPIVLDEVHHIYKERGIVIEEILAYLNLRGGQLLGLSATIPDPMNLAARIGAEYLLISEYRPVPVVTEYERIGGKDDENLASAILRKLLSLPDDEKVLVFVFKKSIGYLLLEKMSHIGLGVLNETLPFLPSTHGEDVAFHNADIPLPERERIESSFREGPLRWLIATQTLAYGVNLPADRVIILARKVKRGSGKIKFLPDSLDILQMQGRAGRFGIKDRGLVNVLVVTRSKNPLEEIMEDLESKRPYLENLSEEGVSLEEYWGVSSHITLMVMGAVASGVSWREFLRNVPSFRGFSEEIFEEVFAYLNASGYVEDGSLTPIGKVLLKNSISPLAYDEFKRRSVEGIEPLLSVRPLMYMKRLRGSLRSFIPPDDYYTEISAFKSKYYTKITLNDGSDELWMFVSGRLYEYPNISNPPGELSFTRSDLFHLARTMVTLHRNGYAFTTLEGILRVMHSYRYGLPYEFAPLGGVEGIGFVRANALYRALEMAGVRWVDFGTFSFSQEVPLLLEEVFGERYGSSERAHRETRITLNLLSQDTFLMDRDLLSLLAFAILGKEALEHVGKKKSELFELLKDRL
ncbi:MAG: DEAD/DEAH box helicase [Thermotogae bacterium]|nr:DEAD/DEAH box helicase [Thermotogota bacterium]